MSLLPLQWPITGLMLIIPLPARWAGSPAIPIMPARGWGMAVSAAVVRRLLRAGYRNIYLFTEDWRLAALRIYLTLGWVPLLYMPDMEGTLAHRL